MRDRPPRPSIYVLPSRIQQGLGDGLELGRAVAPSVAQGHRLLFIPPVGPSHSSRRDGRVVPLDPRDLHPSGFPPVRRCDGPTGSGPAVIVATWWGLAGRRLDDDGGPVPGPWAATVEAIARHHASKGVLTISLEESASARTAAEVLAEGQRQAGWTGRERARHRASSSSRRERATYARAFRAARGAARPDVLHLVPSFHPRPSAARAFPFLLQVGPFWPRARTRPVHDPRSARRPAHVVWYASPSSSATLAPFLDRALTSLDRDVRVTVRAESPFPLPAGSGWRWAPHLGPAGWRRLWDSADLLITTGTQTVVEALEERRPFLYFNGWLPTGGARGFRREKVLSLASAIFARDGQGARDLLAFADGRELATVLERALFDAEWRSRSARWADRVRSGFPPPLADGGRYVASLLSAFGRWTGTVPQFVRTVRRDHASVLRHGGR